jgi:hypothetical protein
MKKSIVAIAIFALTATFAQEMRPPHGGSDRKPPQDAISACQGQESGTTCSMKSPEGDTVTGTCQNTPDEKYFACKPKDRKPE